MNPRTRFPKRKLAWLLGGVCLLIPTHARYSNRAPAAEADSAWLTVHVLDTMLGQPATGLMVVLSRRTGDDWTELARAQTSDAGRIARLLPPEAPLSAGVYRMTFLTGDYFTRRKVKTFYPEVQVVFEVTEPNTHHHLPLILSPYGYSTYRGS